MPPPKPIIDLSIFNITKIPPVLTEEEKEEAKKAEIIAAEKRNKLRSKKLVVDPNADQSYFLPLLHPTTTYPDGRLYYDVHGHYLTRKELGGFYVYPIVNEELPTAFKAETYNNEVLFNTVEHAKVALEHRAFLADAIRHGYKEDTAEKIEEAVRTYIKFDLKNKSTIHTDMLMDGFFTGAMIYDHSIDEQERHYLANMEKEKLTDLAYKYYRRLLEMNQRTPDKLNNLAHIIWYMQGKTFFEKEKVAFKSSMKRMGGSLKRYCASLTLYDDPVPVFWIIFSIRITETPIRRASVLLHGWCQSLLGLAMMEVDEQYAGAQFNGLGPFVLSYLINIAASIAGMPIYALYMESLPGTDKTIESMKTVIRAEMNGDATQDNPPYLKYTDYQTRFAKKPKGKVNPISDYNVDVLYAGVGGSGKFLRDKLIMEPYVVNYWRRWIDTTISIPKAPQMVILPTARAEEGEPKEKRAKVGTCIICKMTNPKFAPGGNKKLGLYCGGTDCYY